MIVKPPKVLCDHFFGINTSKKMKHGEVLFNFSLKPIIIMKGVVDIEDFFHKIHAKKNRSCPFDIILI
jgi:hypothetical protein